MDRQGMTSVALHRLGDDESLAIAFARSGGSFHGDNGPHPGLQQSLRHPPIVRLYLMRVIS